MPARRITGAWHDVRWARWRRPYCFHGAVALGNVLQFYDRLLGVFFIAGTFVICFSADADLLNNPHIPRVSPFMSPNCELQVTLEDDVLEIGSSFGVATDIIAQHARSVIGIDNSQVLVEQVCAGAQAALATPSQGQACCLWLRGGCTMVDEALRGWSLVTACT